MASKATDTKHERIYQACDSCRSKKLRCDLGPVDQPRGPPCARCHRQSKDCTFTTTRNKIAATRDDVDDYVSRNKRRRIQYDGGNHTRNGMTPGRDGHVHRNPEPGTYLITTSGVSNPSSERRQYDPPGISETELLKKAAYTTNDTLNLLYRAGSRSQYTPQVAAASEQLPASGKSTQSSGQWVGSPEMISSSLQSAKKAWSKVKFVQDGLFTADEAIAYIDYFYDHINPFTPVNFSAYKDYSMHLLLTQEEPVLAVTMLMLSSRFLQLPGPCSVSRGYVIHDRLWTFLHRMITRMFWGQDRFPGPNSTARSLRTLGTCEALMLLFDWHPRSLHFADEEDSLSILPREDRDTFDGAKELTGSSPIFWLEWSWRSDRMSWSLHGTALTLAMELGIFDENDNTTLGIRETQAAEWKTTSFHDRALRLQQLFWVYSTRASGRLALGYKYLTQFSLVEKPGLRRDVTTLWVGIASVMRKVNELLFPSRKHPKEIISNGRYLGLLFILKPTLAEWRKDFDAAELSKEMRAILSIEHGYSKVYMNSVALQAVIQHKDSKATKPIHAGNEEFLVDVIHGGREILQTVVDDLLPGDLLKHIPVWTYSRVLAGALFLLKTAALNRSEEEAMISFDLVDKAAKALQVSVVDDVNLSSRWGKLLANLCYEQRLRVTRKYPMTVTPASQPVDGNLAHATSSRTLTDPLNQKEDLTTVQQEEYQRRDPNAAGIWDESSLLDLLDLGHQEDCFTLPDWLGFPLDPLRNVNEVSSLPTAWMSNEGIFDMLGPE